jgi:hypothetical protein
MKVDIVGSLDYITTSNPTNLIHSHTDQTRNIYTHAHPHNSPHSHRDKHGIYTEGYVGRPCLHRPVDSGESWIRERDDGEKYCTVCRIIL